MRSRLICPQLTFIALLIAASAGCAGWHTVKGPPAEYIAKENPDVVRLTLADTSWVLSRPAVRGDSVVGLAKGVHPRIWAGVPSAEIHATEVHSARNKAAGIAAVSVGVLFATIAVVSAVLDAHRAIP